MKLVTTSDGKALRTSDGKALSVSAGGATTNDHSQLTNRNIANQHSISAITGLSTELGQKVNQINGTVISNNADYAEILKWYDNNTNRENRLCRFVELDADTHGNTIKIANANSDVVGVTVDNPAFTGNASEKFDSNGNLLSQYAFVAVHGIVPIIDNGRCSVKGRCMPTSDGTAIPSTNSMGYFCMERKDDTHMMIVVEPNADMLKRIKDIIGDLNNLTTSNKSNLVAAINEAAQTGGSGGSSSVVVDSALSSNSTNPVQNKVIYNALVGKVNTSDYNPTSRTGVMTQKVGKDVDGTLWTAPTTGGGSSVVDNTYTFDVLGTVGSTQTTYALQDGVTKANIDAAAATGKLIKCKLRMTGSSSTYREFWLQSQDNYGNGYLYFISYDSSSSNSIKPMQMTIAATDNIWVDTLPSLSPYNYYIMKIVYSGMEPFYNAGMTFDTMSQLYADSQYPPNLVARLFENYDYDSFINLHLMEYKPNEYFRFYYDDGNNRTIFTHNLNDSITQTTYSIGGGGGGGGGGDETDPIFTASSAAGISSSDIQNWNGKISKSVQAAKTLAMTMPVGIDEDGKLWSIPGSGGGGGGGGGTSVATATQTVSSASSTIQFTNLLGEPTSFVVVSAGNLTTGASPYKTAAVVFDGTNTIGQYITNTNNAQMTYSASAFSKSYSEGTLTITGTNTNFQANQYKLIYSYGGSASDVKTVDVQAGSGVIQISFNVSDEPTYFSCLFKANVGTISGYARANVVAGDGSSVFGMYMGTSDTASATAWTTSYSNGVFTIQSSSNSVGGWFHQPGYYQLTYVTNSGGEGGGGGGGGDETDPIFSASAASLITRSDIQSWDNKSDFSGSYNDLTNKPTIPTQLSQLSEDATHRIVTNTQISDWNGKQSTAITDTDGYFTTDTVEGALQEIGAELAGINTLIGTGVV